MSDSPRAAMQPWEKLGTVATSACIVTTYPDERWSPLERGIEMTIPSGL
jgi:hypothetical protein